MRPRHGRPTPVTISVLVAALAGAGCSQSVVTWRSGQSFRSATAVMPRPKAQRVDDPAAALLERELRRRGLRFGTDGSLGAVYAYVRNRHRRVDPGQARTGDVIFFDVHGDGDDCGNHGGVVEEVDADGRITYRAWRDGAAGRWYVHPDQPRTRRDRGGRVMNSFLRTKHPDDPAGLRYYAGEMVCGVYRLGRR